MGIDKPDDIELLAGYLYVLFDSKQPDIIKIGCTTNIEKRLASYNKDRQEDLCSYVYVSQYLGDIFTLEKIILKRLTTCIDPLKGNEWFPIKCKDLLISEVKRTEDILNELS
jgi:hypothetical protein